MKNEEDEEEKSHLIEVTPVIEFEKLDKGNYFKNIAYNMRHIPNTVFGNTLKTGSRLNSQLWNKIKVLLAKCFGAVVGCYLIYGICHEAITRQVCDLTISKVISTTTVVLLAKRPL